jgi:hypothetical protein
MSKKIKIATLANVLALGPCYGEDKVRELFGRRRALSAQQICALPIRIADRLWALSRLGMVSHEALIGFAVDCALRIEKAAAAASPAFALTAAVHASAVSAAAAAAYAAAAYAAAAAAYAAAAAFALTAAAHAAAAYADDAYAAAAAAVERKLQDESLWSYIYDEQEIK